MFRTKISKKVPTIGGGIPPPWCPIHYRITPCKLQLLYISDRIYVNLNFIMPPKMDLVPKFQKSPHRGRGIPPLPMCDKNALPKHIRLLCKKMLYPPPPPTEMVRSNIRCSMSSYRKHTRVRDEL